MGPEDYAKRWVTRNKDAIAPLMQSGFDLRTVVLRELAIDTETGVARAGLPGLYLAVRAPYDRDCYDLVSALAAGQGQQPEGVAVLCGQIADGTLSRPSAKRGRLYKNGGRDFVLTVLVAELQEAFPSIPFGGNEATENAKPATEIALRALEAEGFKVLDDRKPSDDFAEPSFRSIEKALRRFQDEQKIPELFF